MENNTSQISKEARINEASLYFQSGEVNVTFDEALKAVQRFISEKYAMMISDDPAKSKDQLMSYIGKFLIDSSLKVDELSNDELVERLYREMAEFSFLTKYLYRKDVEEININAHNDIKVTYSDGNILPTKEKFNSPSHAVDVIRRLLHASGVIFDQSQPVVRGHLSNKIRITVFGEGVIDSDKGVAASIRIVNPQKLSKNDFIKKETATEEILDFLSLALRYGCSMCVTGATSSGKTTLMSWVLETIPYKKRILTIENGVREFDLVVTDSEGNVLNDVIHTVTRYSDDPKQNIDQEKLLETALTANPDIICVGEMKGPEAFAAQEAARTDHAVITTTHANSCEATYRRMATLCKMKYDIAYSDLHDLVTEAFPIVLYTKKLEDNSRKVMEITECVIHPDTKREIKTLWKYNIQENNSVDGSAEIVGKFEKVNDISKGLQKRLSENGMPASVLSRFVTEVNE